MNHRDDDDDPFVSPPDRPLEASPETLPETLRDMPAPPSVAPEAVPEPAPDVAPPRRRPWRKWLLYVFAGLGVLALAFAALVAFAVLRDHKVAAPVLSRDAVIDESMTRNYGKYSPEQQGWLYVDPATRRAYVMQVLQRAQVDVPSTTMTGVTAVYFLVSGTSTLNGSTSSMLGLFMIQPDTVAHDGTLAETADAVHWIDGDTPVTAQDVRFESLSKDTWGWVVKIVRSTPETPAARVVDDVVFAPHEGHMTTLATFPASGTYTADQGCERSQAMRDQALAAGDPASGAAGSAASEAASAASVAVASASASASEPAPAASDADDDEDAGEGTEPDVPLGCSAASWTYRTGDLPADGFVTITVTGGGRINGADVSSKTYKLVFDPKSFTYLMPPDMPSF